LVSKKLNGESLDYNLPNNYDYLGHERILNLKKHPWQPIFFDDKKAENQ